MITSAGFSLNDKVADIIVDNTWKWPSEWTDRFPNIQIPVLNTLELDRLMWKDSNQNLLDFSVNVVWEDLRPQAAIVDWFPIVWFNQNVPKHAFILWLIFKQKLKTQDIMAHWDVNRSLSLCCSLCELQPDSHNRLFFECPFSSQVWNSVKSRAELNNVAPDWMSIVAAILPIASKSSVQSVVAKLVLAASTYFIWDERNARLFRQQKRTRDQLIGAIVETVRLKLLTCRFKRTRRVERFLTAWDLPVSLIR
uniref:uncharacterized protein LOC122609026 n=1 Tax=Erigeron canadensis TaxID=72917 RepID=UPI001CB98BA3|nr:uncharacterized protein LOC122609026 [Erigeron canadensis]